jgi:hypothetical protein
MAIPTTRQTFKDYCLRRLGSGAINIEITDEQAEERISDALQLYMDHHYDGSQKFYYKYKLTQTDIENKYITLPENIIGVSGVFPFSTFVAMNSIFSFQYQYTLNHIFDLTSTELAPYYMAMQYLQMVEQLLVGQQRVRFNRHTDQLHIDMDWARVTPDYYILVECYQVIDPAEYPDVWNDRWLKEYATALMKLQWAGNLNKFKGQKLPGGMEFNADTILRDAREEKKTLEDELIDKYGGVLEFFEG